MRRTKTTALMIIGLAGVACDDVPNISGVPGYLISTIRVSPSIDTLFVPDPIRPTDRATFTAIAIGKNGADLGTLRYVWTTSDSLIATVDSFGVVTPHAYGTIQITASAYKEGTATLVILPAVTRVSVSPPVSEVLALDTVKLTAQAYDDSGNIIPSTFMWTSSNPSVATVDSQGTVNVLAAGEATITARTALASGSTTITVFERKLLAVDAGEEFTCGFTALGRGYCWGRETVGQTAAEADSTCFPTTAIQREGCTLPPKRMLRPELAFTAIAAGGEFACGIVTNQMLYCWGNDESGQIGNGGDGGGSTPSLATVKSERFTAVTAGAAHACALNLARTAYCWGDDTHGQLGDNRNINSSTPIPVVDTSLAFASISAGAQHTCALTTAGTAYCWGAGGAGQLGNGGTGDVPVPRAVAGGLSFTAISAGDAHTCAIDSSGVVYCWGNNVNGELGNGVTGDIGTTPTPVVGSDRYTAVSAGGHHTCGIANGLVRCWGFSDWAQVGNGAIGTFAVASPVQVSGPLAASAITAGANHTCAIASADGLTWCWGSNRWGTLGNEYQAALRATPQLVARPR